MLALGDIGGLLGKGIGAKDDICVDAKGSDPKSPSGAKESEWKPPPGTGGSKSNPAKGKEAQGTQPNGRSVSGTLSVKGSAAKSQAWRTLDRPKSSLSPSLTTTDGAVSNGSLAKAFVVPHGSPAKGSSDGWGSGLHVTDSKVPVISPPAGISSSPLPRAFCRRDCHCSRESVVDLEETPDATTPGLFSATMLALGDIGGLLGKGIGAKDDICGSWGLAGAPAPAAGSWA
jgi:hypothetical protein